MRYFVGLVMAGAALLGQAPAADAQVTLGNPNSGYSVTVGQPNPYATPYGTSTFGQPVYPSQPVTAYPQPYQPRTRYYNYNSGYGGYTTYPSALPRITTRSRLTPLSHRCTALGSRMGIPLTATPRIRTPARMA